jgi:hypothetical protein
VVGERRRPGKVVAAIAVGLLVVLALAYVLGREAGAPGPLIGVDGGGVTQPLRPGDTGSAWGMHTLGNPTGDPITLREVRLVGADGLVQAEEPYIWDEERLKLGFGTFGATVTPFPPGWDDVTRHPVDGYVIAPHEGIDGNTGVGAEVGFTFAAADEVQRADGIEVEYEWRGRTHTRVFRSYFVMCPVSDTSECRSPRDSGGR